MQKTMKPLLIGELALQGGVKADSVRFYERAGLLPKPERSSNGYRVYDENALARLRFIKKAQALGFSLEEIRRILNLHGNPNETCRCVISMAESTLEETERKAEQLRSFAEQLRTNLERWKKMSPRRDRMASEFCALIESRQITPGKGAAPLGGI